MKSQPDLADVYPSETSMGRCGEDLPRDSRRSVPIRMSG